MDEYSILKKKHKKNGFAATSLLISIALALLVLVGAVLVLGKVDSQKLNAVNDDTNETLGSNTTCIGLTKEMVFNTNIRDIKEAAINYFTNERLPQTVGDKVTLTLKEMKDNKLIVNVIDSIGNSCSDDKTYVEVTKEENEYIMKIFLSCTDGEDYIIVHLGCYDYCDKNICEKDVKKEYEYEYRKTTNCIMTDWSNWGNWKLTREKTSNLKKEDTKTETSTKEVTDTKSATKTVTYNCNKYAGYTLVGDKCVKETIITDTKDATPSKYSYNCDNYPGYSVVGDKCIKETKVKEVINATQNPITYSCPSGYTKNGTKCERTVTKTDTKSGSYSCPSGYSLSGTTCSKTTTNTSTASGSYSCPSGYSLSGSTCSKTTTNTSTASGSYSCPSGYSLSGSTCSKTTTWTDNIKADPVYATRTVTKAYACKKQQCTTKTVFSCPTGKSCGNYPQTSCEYVNSTCYNRENEEYLAGYRCPTGYSLSGANCSRTLSSTDTKAATFNCPSGYSASGTSCIKQTTSTDTKGATFNCPSGYSVSGTSCIKKTTGTDTKTATFNCPSGYTANNGVCTRKYEEKETIDASQDQITYYCPSGYTKNGTKCEREVIKTDTRTATKVEGGYVCSEGYTLNDKKCTKTTINKEIKDASESVKYSCTNGYNLSNNTCTKKTTQNVKTTYYRYATRTCNGGSTDTKWSTSNNDSILKSEGYTLTGNKKEIIVK